MYRVSQKKVGSQKFSNCSNSLNFEAKINCNTIKPNVPKWRKTCTGLKFDLLHFYGPQSHILSGDTFDGPCICRKLMNCKVIRVQINIQCSMFVLYLFCLSNLHGSGCPGPGHRVQGGHTRDRTQHGGSRS